MEHEKKETLYTEDTITLILDGGIEVECDILTIFSIREQFYAALMPQSPVDGYEEGEYFLYRYSSDGENVELSDLESEEEWEACEDKFEELLDEEEFNSMKG